MSNSAYHYLERMLPELQELQEYEILTESEVKSIIKKRKDFEFMVHRRISKKTDYLQYIQYESNLERLIQIRYQKKKSSFRKQSQQKNGSDSVEEEGKKNKQKQQIPSKLMFKPVKRIHALYQKTLKKFGDDQNLWLEYFKWAQSKQSSKRMGTAFTRAIQLFPKTPMFWILSAGWEFENNANIATARKIFQRGLRLNQKSAKLWLEYLKMELLFMEKVSLRKEFIQQNMNEHESSDDDDESIDGNNYFESAAAQNVDAEEDMNMSQDIQEKKLDENGNEIAKPDLASILIIIYKNSIKEIPANWEFRINVLRNLKLASERTKSLQIMILETFPKDFSDNMEAIKNIVDMIMETNESNNSLLESLIECLDVFELCYDSNSSHSVLDSYESFVNGFENSEKLSAEMTEILKIAKNNISSRRE